MQRTPVVFAFAIHALVLAGCDRPQQVSVNALAADPARLHAARAVPRGRARRRVLRAGGTGRPAALSLRPGRAE